MKRLVQIVESCGDCYLCSAMGLDGVAHAHCGFPGKYRALPANGKESTELMVMEIPDWCPLPEATAAEEAEQKARDLAEWQRGQDERARAKEKREANWRGQQTSQTSSPAPGK